RQAPAVAGRRGADGGGAGEAGAGGSPASGGNARHQLVHRLRPAVHSGGLPGARAAACGWRARGGGSMTRLAIACLLLFAGAVPATAQDTHASQWPLSPTVEGAGAYRVELDASVYRQALAADLR